VFYIRYDLYRNYFPILALATYSKGIEKLAEEMSTGPNHQELGFEPDQLR